MNRPMFLYECTDCAVVFAVEEAFEYQSEIVCPVCENDAAIEDRGFGDFVLTQLPEVTAND